jgi:MFS family permease
VVRRDRHAADVVGIGRDVDASAAWAPAAVGLGAGTALVYPTLLAAVVDVAHPAWRARSVGVYRLWRDGGFAVAALLAGVVADVCGLRSAIWVVAALPPSRACSSPYACPRRFRRGSPDSRERPPAPGCAPVARTGVQTSARSTTAADVGPAAGHVVSRVAGTSCSG